MHTSVGKVPGDKKASEVSFDHQLTVLITLYCLHIRARRCRVDDRMKSTRSIWLCQEPSGISFAMFRMSWDKISFSSSATRCIWRYSTTAAHRMQAPWGTSLLCSTRYRNHPPRYPAAVITICSTPRTPIPVKDSHDSSIHPSSEYLFRRKGGRHRHTEVYHTDKGC